MKKFQTTVFTLFVATILLYASSSKVEGLSYMTVEQPDPERPIITKLNFDNEIMDNKIIKVSVVAQITNRGKGVVDGFAFTGPLNFGEVAEYKAIDDQKNELSLKHSQLPGKNVSVDVRLARPIEPGMQETIYFEYQLLNAVENDGKGSFQAKSAQLSPSIGKDTSVVVYYTFKVPEGYFYYEAFPNQASMKDNVVTYKTNNHASQFNIQYGTEKKLLSGRMYIYILFPITLVVVGSALFLLRKVR